MKTQIALTTIAVSGIFLSHCSTTPTLPVVENLNHTSIPLKSKLLTPRTFVTLDSKTCSIPDGLAKSPTGDIILSAPNYVDYKKVGGAKLFKISPDKKVSVWFDKLSIHPDTGEVHPMGIEFGPDGNLYIADNQYFNNKDYKSRLLRVVVENGVPIRCETVVSGFKLANAVRWNKDKVYVSDTHFDLADTPNQSGVYAISLKEMNKGEVKLHPGAKDKHLVSQYTAKDSGTPHVDNDGADGICFDNKNRMYTGNFGDGVISRTIFDDKGVPIKQDIIIDNPSLNCCDGITYDERTNKVYITNSKRNSIHAYDVDKGTLQIIAENGNTTGVGGALDQPCEPLVLGNKLIIVNFDMPFPGMKNTTHETPIGISEITLP